MTLNNSDREEVPFRVDFIEIHMKSNPIPSSDGELWKVEFLSDYELLDSKFCAKQVLGKKNVKVNYRIIVFFILTNKVKE